MQRNRIIEPIGFIIAFITLVFSFILFSNDTAEPAGSFLAALLSAALVWVSYVILRWLFLAARSP